MYTNDNGSTGAANTKIESGGLAGGDTKIWYDTNLRYDTNTIHQYEYEYKTNKSQKSKFG